MIMTMPMVKLTKEEWHPTPRGCQWAESCDRCPWSDCVIPTHKDPLPYMSAQAAVTRSAYIRSQLKSGATALELSRLFGVHEKTVRRYARTSVGTRRCLENVAGQQIRMLRATRNRCLMRQHAEGVSAKALAVEHGVTVHHVYRLLRGSDNGS